MASIKLVLKDIKSILTALAYLLLLEIHVSVTKLGSFSMYNVTIINYRKMRSRDWVLIRSMSNCLCVHPINAI